MAAGHDTDYVHGQMDVTMHERTYRGFMAASKWLSLTTLAIVLMFTLWFCVDGVGFLGAFVTTALFVAGGFWFIRFFFPPPGKGGH